MIAQGAANAASGIVGSFVVDGSLSKTAVGDGAGQKTPLASVALSAAIVVTVLFLTGLFENLPEATLGAIVIHAVWHLIDFDKVTRNLSLRRDDFWAGAAAVFAVLLFDILIGLIIAIAVSFILLLARASRPPWSILGRTRDEDSDEVVFRSVETHPDAETFPGLLITRFDGNLFFANANVFVDDVLSAATAADPKPPVVVLDAESIDDIDSTALIALRDLRRELDDLGIELWAARVKTRLREAIERVDGLAPERMHPTVRAALRANEQRPTTGADRH